METLQVLTLVVASMSFIVAIGALFLACWTRRTIVHGGSGRTQHYPNATTPPCHEDRDG
jgi:hypothetical protein